MKDITVYFTVEWGDPVREDMTRIDLSIDDDVLTDILSDNMGYRIDLKSMLWLYCKLMKYRFVDIDGVEIPTDDIGKKRRSKRYVSLSKRSGMR